MAIPWYRKLAYACITTIAFFGLLELSLYVIGVRPVTETEDPFVGFSAILPLYVAVDGHSELRTTADNKAPWFNPQTFPAKKPEGVYRIVCLGGSTTYGRPFRDATSFCGWLRDYLNYAQPARKWEVINAGGVSYASYRVSAVMEEMIPYEPDLFIVYTGQNEFLEWRTYDGLLTQDRVTANVLSRLSTTRTFALIDRATKGLRQPAPKPKRYELPGEVDEMLNHTIGPTSYERDAEWRAQVLQHFEKNLQRMTALASAANAKILFVTPASNLKDCSPFRSDPGVEISTEVRESVDLLLASAQAMLSQSQIDSAAELLREAVAKDPDRAESQYALGRALFQLKDYDGARVALDAALQADVCPLRAVREIVESVRSTAASKDAMFVDFERRLADHCEEEFGHRCMGSELFLDHVHPTIEAHRLLGEWIYEELLDNEIVDASLDDETRAAVAAKVEAEIDEEDHGIALRNLAKVLHWAGKFDEAGPLALKALDLIPDDFASMAVAADCLREMGRIEESVIYYEAAIGLDPTFHQAYMRLGQIYSRNGDYERARTMLEGGLLIEPEVAFAQYEHGFVLLRLGEPEKAIEALTKALELAPEDVDTMFFLGQAHGKLQQLDQAESWLSKVVAKAPGDAQAQCELGAVFLEQGKAREAAEAFEAAINLRPDYEEAQIGLDLAREEEAGAK